MHLGAMPFSIYNTYTPEQIEYLVNDAGAPVAIVEQQYRGQDPRRPRRSRASEHVVVIDGDGPDGAMSLDELDRARRPELRLRGRLAGGRARRPPDADLHLGHHRPAEGRADHALEHLRDRPLLRRDDPVPRRRPDRLLPADGAHRRAQRQPLPADAVRLHGHVLPGRRARSSRYLPEVRPTWFFAVPRIWEKLKAGLEQMLAALPRRAAASRSDAALEAALEKVRLEQAGEEVPAELADAVAKADEAVFSQAPQPSRARRARGLQRRRRADPAGGDRVLPRARDPARRAVGHVRDLRRRHLQPAASGSRSARSGPPVPASRSSSPRTARC